MTLFRLRRRLCMGRSLLAVAIAGLAACGGGPLYSRSGPDGGEPDLLMGGEGGDARGTGGVIAPGSGGDPLGGGGRGVSSTGGNRGTGGTGAGTRMTGKVENAIGTMIGSSALKAKGLQKEQEANAVKAQTRELQEAERLEHEALMRRERAVGHG